VTHELQKLHEKDDYYRDGKYSSDKDSLDTPLNGGPRPVFYFMDA